MSESGQRAFLTRNLGKKVRLDEQDLSLAEKSCGLVPAQVQI